MSAINVDNVDGGELVKNLINSVDTVLFDIDGKCLIGSLGPGLRIINF